MSRYSDAVEAGYDGDDPLTEARQRNFERKNNMLDERDPDYVEPPEEDDDE